MAQRKSEFSIDDKLSLSENLKAFGSALATVDAQLSATLSSHLVKLATGQAPAGTEILNALFLSTKASQFESASNDESAERKDTA